MADHDRTMPLVIAIAWVGPPAVLVLLLISAIRSSRMLAPTSNAIATGVAAASVVFVFFIIAGLSIHGPLAVEPKPGWGWKVPTFAAYAATFAWCSGWCCATLYLAGREYMRGHWGGPRCPRPMTASLAFVALLALTAFYVDYAQRVATTITASSTPPAIQDP